MCCQVRMAGSASCLVAGASAPEQACHVDQVGVAGPRPARASLPVSPVTPSSLVLWCRSRWERVAAAAGAALGCYGGGGGGGCRAWVAAALGFFSINQLELQGETRRPKARNTFFWGGGVVRCCWGAGKARCRPVSSASTRLPAGHQWLATARTRFSFGFHTRQPVEFHTPACRAPTVQHEPCAGLQRLCCMQDTSTRHDASKQAAGVDAHCVRARRPRRVGSWRRV
jgi:hypothetical protein